jgi:hypothetical protein
MLQTILLMVVLKVTMAVVLQLKMQKVGGRLILLVLVPLYTVILVFQMCQIIFSLINGRVTVKVTE